MNKLYTKQSVLLRKEVEMAVDISKSQPEIEVVNDFYRFKKNEIHGPIPEIIDKYKTIISTFDFQFDSKLHSFSSSIIKLAENDFIRPHSLASLEENSSYLLFTLVDKSKDQERGSISVFSGDGYQGIIELDKFSTLVFSSHSKFEIHRILKGTVSYIMTTVNKA